LGFKNELRISLPGMFTLHPLLKNILILTGYLCLSGCSTLAYYAQSIHGHIEILSQRQPINKYLQERSRDSDTARKLRLVLDLLAFSNNELHLPDNGSYRSYSDIGREFVIWNVFATPRLSLQPEQWCYLIVGCLNYRGYYSKADAIGFTRKLDAQDFDVFMGGVAAYSTLGWFNDPVLNTMLRWNDAYLAKVIFHELAHQKLYIKDDTEFNEAFADTVAMIATGLWLRKTGSLKEYREFLMQQKYDRQFIELILEYKHKLSLLYASAQSDEDKLVQKQIIFHDLQDQFSHLRTSWLDYNVYDSWIEKDLNNAKLAAFATYRELIPAFMVLYEASGNDLETFYQRVIDLSHCKKDARRQRLYNQHIQGQC